MAKEDSAKEPIVGSDIVYTLSRQELEELCTTALHSILAAMVREEFLDEEDATFWGATHLISMKHPNEISPYHEDYFSSNDSGQLYVLVSEIRNLFLKDGLTMDEEGNIYSEDSEKPKLKAVPKSEIKKVESLEDHKKQSKEEPAVPPPDKKGT